MSEKRAKLTRRIVEGAEVGAGERFIWDSEVSGFGVRIRPSGRRGYVLQYRFAGRTRRYQIGTHGSPWTVETARDQAKILMGQIAGGEDPQDAKAGARKELTVAQLCDLYLAEGLVAWSKKLGECSVPMSTTSGPSRSSSRRASAAAIRGEVKYWFSM